MMTSKDRKATLAFLSTVAHCAERAADHTGRDRELGELRDVIARQERQHRALGRAMVGDIGARMSVAQTVDYFTARVLADGCRPAKGFPLGMGPGYLGATIETLDGLREDYVRGAILASNNRFRADFLARLAGAFPGMSERAIWVRIAETDYCELVDGGGK